MNDPKNKTRADFMTPAQKHAMGKLPRTHANCIDKTEVARPGKTAHEAWRKNERRD